MEQDSSPIIAPDEYGGKEIKENPWGARGRTAQFQIFSTTLTTAQPRATFTPDFEAEFWHFAVVTEGTVLVTAYMSSGTGGSGLPFTGGGRVKNWPANANDPALTCVMNVGTDCVVVGIAIYGLPNFDYQPGVLA
jgi:hypothetical protein